MPIGGGGYFRLIRFGLLRRLLKKVQDRGQSLVMYLHPWELDPEQPKMNGPLLSRFRHYVNLRKTEDRLTQLLREFCFGPILEAIVSIRELNQRRIETVQPEWSISKRELHREGLVASKRPSKRQPRSIR